METSAKARYSQLETDRNPYLDRARDCAALTIPTLLPPSGSTGATKLPTPWQGLGARCVNSLAAKLLLALFPPSAPFFKLTVTDFALQALKAKRGDVETALGQVERAVVTEIETTATRPALFEALKHLITTGNCLLYVPRDGAPKVFRLDRYVVKRDPMGNLLELVTHETLSPMELSDSDRAKITPQDGAALSNTDTLDLYTRVVKGMDGKWHLTQEVKDVVLRTATYADDKLPYRPLRLIAVTNEDYGRGLVEEYLGDFKSLEALTQAITEGAVAAAKLLILVNPNGVTKKSDVAGAPNGAVRSGRREDVSTVQSEKQADLRVAYELRNGLEKQLSLAFLLTTAVQRNAERVTAEEIRIVVQELETGLGGIYSNLSQELQLPLVVIIMDRLTDQQRLPKLPKQFVKPAITTGMDAIGRGAERSRLTSYIGTLAQMDPSILNVIDMRELAARLAVSDGIDTTGLIKDQQTIDAEAAQAQQQALAQKAAPNIVNQAGAMMQQAQQ